MTPPSVENFRTLMRSFASPICVISTQSSKGPCAMTASSVVSTSLEPLLLSFNVGKKSRMHQYLSNAKFLCIHLLASDQSFVANHFAQKHSTKEQLFENIETQEHANGLTLIKNCLGYFICEKWKEYEAGDHDLYLAKVIETFVETPQKSPLIYHQRNYSSLSSTPS